MFSFSTEEIADLVKRIFTQGGGFVMSESRGFPAELLSFLLFGVLGVAVTAAALACFAQLMAGQGCSGSVVPILAKKNCEEQADIAFGRGSQKLHGAKSPLKNSDNAIIPSYQPCCKAKV